MLLRKIFYPSPRVIADLSSPPFPFPGLSSRTRSPAFRRTGVRDLLLPLVPKIPPRPRHRPKNHRPNRPSPHRPHPRHPRPHQASRRIPRPPQTPLRRLFRRRPGRRPPSHPSHQRQTFRPCRPPTPPPLDHQAIKEASPLFPCPSRDAVIPNPVASLSANGGEGSAFASVLQSRLSRPAVFPPAPPHPRHLRPHQPSRRIPRPPQTPLRRLLGTLNSSSIRERNCRVPNRYCRLPCFEINATHVASSQ
jgi:hypothetical protein